MIMHLQKEESRRVIEKILDEEHIERLLKKLKEHHEPTYDHSLRVGMVSVDVAYKHNIQDKELRSLGTGALLYDIGKIKIPCSLLNSTEKLSEEQREIIKVHPRYGLELVDTTDPIIRRIIVGHHEYK